MSRLKTPVPRTRKLRSKRDVELTLDEAIRRVDNPRIAESLSVFYARLARAQEEGDDEAIEYIRDSIAEAMRGVPEGAIDEPLLPLRRAKAAGRKR